MSCDFKGKNFPAERLVGIVVCGPCACGKTEVASALAQHYNVPCVDADTFHPESNISKMSSGIPLTDEDRFPWLVIVRQQMILQKKVKTTNSTESQQQYQVPQVGVIAACSALTKKYRDILRGEKENSSAPLDDDKEDQLPVIFVFLNCSKEVLQERLNARQGHFMKANMLSSQLATLEVPNDEAQHGRAIIVNGDEELSNVLKEATGKIQAILDSK